jgi:NAD(P)-dependent dehydrogenase (short-subunit alcohol dehydrogenase family)
MARAAVPAMRKAKWGRIVSVSSKAALWPGPKRATYAASKAAILGFTRSLALDLAPFGITVNAVCPARSAPRATSTNRREYGDDPKPASERSGDPGRPFGSPDSRL